MRKKKKKKKKKKRKRKKKKRKKKRKKKKKKKTMKTQREKRPNLIKGIPPTVLELGVGSKQRKAASAARKVPLFRKGGTILTGPVFLGAALQTQRARKIIFHRSFSRQKDR